MEKYYECVCPLCKKLNNNFFLKYPGIFFGITELRKCNICDLVFGHEFPNKDELDEYYKLGFYYDGIPNKFDPKILNWHFKVCESRLNVILTNVNYDFQNVIDIGGGFAKFGHVLYYNIPHPHPYIPEDNQMHHTPLYFGCQCIQNNTDMEGIFDYQID